MPARRKNKRKKKQLDIKVKIVKFIGIAILLITTISLIGFFSSDGEWDTDKKISFVVNSDPEIVVTSIDPGSKEIYSVMIPAETQVEVARNLGQWKLGSVWDLGFNEGLEGLLLAETVTRHFYLPTYLYIESQDTSFLEGNLLSAVRILLSPTASNIGRKDLLKIIRFTSSVKNPNRKAVDLKNTNYLTQKQLKGGGMGYIKTKDLDQRIIAPFSNDYISGTISIVKIINNSKNRLVSSDLGKVIEATGAKVAQVVNNEESQGNCMVSSKDVEIGEYYSKLFSCDYERSSNDNFDVVITLNQDFVDRY
ncbi:hypothetical protein JXA63_02980 [Candidatus Woesebacteria bacterium]|nr:hypothetical protein [Candidatus Woesebacteria bacterium]